MTMQKTYNRRRKYLLSRSVRRNPWTNRGYRIENVLKNILAVTRKMLEFYTPHRRLTSMDEAQTYLERGYAPSEMIVAGPIKSIEFTPTNSGPYRSILDIPMPIESMYPRFVLQNGMLNSQELEELRKINDLPWNEQFSLQELANGSEDASKE